MYFKSNDLGERVPLTAEEEAQHIKDIEAAVSAHKELLSKEVRQTRDDLLLRTDYTQTSPAFSDAKKVEWAAYRQALRDVPQQAGFPDNIQWPVKPE